MFAFRRDPDGPSGVGVAFTDRLDGVSTGSFASLNLSDIRPDDDANERANAQLVASALGVESLIGVWQVHGAHVLRVPASDADAEALLDWDMTRESPYMVLADAMVTTAENIGLCIRVADCVPVLLGDSNAGVIGAAHAGRKGMLGGVVEATIEAMRELGARDIDAWIGPHICGQCYEVPSDMAEAAWQQLPATRATTRKGTPAIDLGAGAAAELERLGCAVHVEASCTFENPALFSYRRDGDQSGRQAGIVWRR